MKRETTPTSPKYKNKPQSKINSWPIVTLVLSILFGFVAGFLGHVISESYAFLELPEVIPTKEEVIIVKEKSESERAAAIKKVVEGLKPSLLNIYTDSYQGAAAVLTSDGWLVTSLDLPTEFTLVNKDQKEYSPDKIITNSWSGLSFIKINAQNLSVAEFGWPEKGEELLAYYYTPQNQENLAVNYLTTNNYYYSEQRSTDNYYRLFLLSQNLSPNYKSAPVINLSGKIVGFHKQENKILPAEIISNLANQVIKNQEIKNIDLGLSYYDLAYSYNQSEDYNKGALITGSENEDLEIGDLILKVEDAEIDEYNDLNYILQKYYDQDTINLSVLRNSEEIEINIEL